jgi:protoporphyrin/coproporphyrin ferrochelatase
MVAERIAVLLMAYGGPGSLDDVEPYLLDVRGGRATSPELVHEIHERYRAIGGRSPILELTEAQAAGLGRILGSEYDVSVGMRHWHPFISEAVKRIAARGHRRLVGIAMAPHYSAMSVGAYEKKVLEAVAANGGQSIDVALVRSWGDHPGFIEAVRAQLAAALARIPSPRQVEVIFTAHSLPERILMEGDPYVDQLRSSAAAVAARAGIGDHWRFAFQSAGRSPEPWLGPEAGAVISELAGQGRREFLLVPIGFVCDHVEILYDIDVEFQALARSLGVRLERTASLNDSPLLLDVLADITRTAAAERGWIP